MADGCYSEEFIIMPNVCSRVFRQGYLSWELFVDIDYSHLRCMGSIIFGFSLPVLYMFKYSLISVISCCICFIKYLIPVWCIMNSECNSKDPIAVNSVCMCIFMFNIVSFMLNMVSMIMLAIIVSHQL